MEEKRKTPKSNQMGKKRKCEHIDDAAGFLFDQASLLFLQQFLNVYVSLLNIACRTL